MSIVRFLLPLVLVLATCWARDPILEEVQPIVFDDVPQDYRLQPYNRVKPKNYNIALHPYFEDVPKGIEEFSFIGKVEISLTEPDENITTITLHARNLNFTKVMFRYEQEEKIHTVDAYIGDQSSADKERDFIRVVLQDIVPKGAKNCYLTFDEYVGTLKNEDLYGFYRSSYEEQDNTEWLATTQFEPVHARRAFPCFDEPAMKATFDISITHPSDYTAISNMPAKEKPKEKKKQADNNDITTEFETTSEMSTYLVAFVISKFESISNKTSSVWTRPDESDSAKKFALDRGIKILSELEDYTGIKYYKPSKSSDKSMDMSKMDQIGIPQFPAGAMENWGLVTYRESSLLYTPNVSTVQDETNVVTTISHEFAHQWFGDLVTPEWWEYIWLNEGFATFFQYFITDQVQENNGELSWRLMEQFVVKALQESAFVTDASTSTRPLNKDATKPDDIQSMFDNIAYKKGACVIRMMQHFLTEKNFKEGLTKYLTDNMYGSVTSDHLFNATEATKDKKVKLSINNIMKNWVEQPGYPVITIEREKNGDRVINQQRFFLSGPSKTDKTKWYIPINYVTEDDSDLKNTTADIKLWLEATKVPLRVKNLKDKKWVIFNYLQTGYYRVNYDKTNWKLLADYLQTDKYENIQPVSRAQLIDDALNLARAGYLTYDDALPITLYLDKEIDYIPLYAAIRNLDFMDRNLQSMSNYKLFQKYVARRLKRYADEVGLTDTPNNTTYFYQLGREMVLTASCRYGLEECNKYALEKLNKWIDDKKELPINLRDGILCAGVRQANQKTWNATLEIFKNRTDGEKVALLNALGCVQDEKVIRTFLEISLEDDAVIGVFQALNTICVNNYGSFDILIDFISENIEKIHEKDKNKFELTKYINQLAGRVTNEKQYGKLLLFIMRENLQSDSFDGMEIGKENLDWIQKNQEVISKWIEKHSSGANSITAMSFLMVISLLIVRFY